VVCEVLTGEGVFNTSKISGVGINFVVLNPTTFFFHVLPGPKKQRAPKPSTLLS
jgi:hypothetical protein